MRFELAMTEIHDDVERITIAITMAGGNKASFGDYYHKDAFFLCSGLEIVADIAPIETLLTLVEEEQLQLTTLLVPAACEGVRPMIGWVTAAKTSGTKERRVGLFAPVQSSFDLLYCLRHGNIEAFIDKSIFERETTAYWRLDDRPDAGGDQAYFSLTANGNKTATLEIYS